MDLPQADPDNAKAEIEDVIGIDATDAIPCSAKTGMGIDEILEAVIARMPGAARQPRRRAARDDHRQLVRQLCRRRDAGARGRRLAGQGRAHPADGHQHRLPDRAPGCVHAQEREPRRAACRRGGLRHRRHQGTAGRQGGRHHHAGKEAAQQRRPGHRAAARLQGDPAAGLRRPVPDRGQRIRLSCATRWRSSSSTTARCATSPRSARRWASASAAASSACCTWRSCRSAWSASSTRTW
jgi:hypothetical protein